MTLPKYRIGDKGQRYEIRFKESESGDEKEMVLGWSNTVEGAFRMAGGITLHPCWHSPVVFDRKDNRIVGKEDL